MSCSSYEVSENEFKCLAANWMQVDTWSWETFRIPVSYLFLNNVKYLLDSCPLNDGCIMLVINVFSVILGRVF